MHEGIGDTIFESQVLLHCTECRRHNVDFDILTYELFSSVWTRSLLNKNNFDSLYDENPVILKRGVNQYIPFASIMNSFLFLFFIITNRSSYDFIHARSDYSAFIAVITKPFHRLPIVWDCRGDSQDELHFAFEDKSKFLRWTLGFYCSFANRLILKAVSYFANSAVFVSSALRRYHVKKGFDQMRIVVPCVVSPDRFFFDQSLRAESRKALNISEDFCVYLYSGSMVPYQGISHVINFAKALGALKHKSVLLVLTKQTEVALAKFNGLLGLRVIVESVSHSDVNFYCNAADYALLFRDARNLNFVASPTKHGEYRMSGLPVITNGTVEQVNEFNASLDELRVLEPRKLIQSEKVRSTISSCSKQWFSREVYINEYIELYKSCCGGFD